MLFFGNGFYFRDLTIYYYPTKQIIRETILRGDFPFWNRFYSGGQPMAANPEYEIFYPPQWLILIPSYSLGFRLHILVHFFIAAIGMYAFLHSLRLSAAASFFGALTFTLSGAYLSFVNLLPILFAVTWMPLVFLFARRFFIRPNARDFALTSIFLGMQVLVGEPTTALQTAVLLGCYVLWRSWRTQRTIPAVARNVGLLAAMGGAGLLIGAVQALPAFDHVGDSVRSRPFPFAQVTTWSLPPVRPLELFFPNILGPLAENAGLYWGAELYPNVQSPFIQSIYLGLFAAVLVAAGMLCRLRGAVFVAVIAVCSFLVALGGHAPFYRLFYLAGLRSIRYPEKFALTGLFVLAVFAAVAFDQLARGDQQMRRMVLRCAIAVTVVAFFLALFAHTPAYLSFFMRFWGVEGGPPATIMARISATDWLVACGRGALLILVIATVTRMRPALWLGLVAIFVVADLGTQANRILPRMPARFFELPPIAASLRPERKTYRVFHEAQRRTSSDEWRRYALTAGGDVVWLYRNGLFPMITASAGFQAALEVDVDATALLPTADLVTAHQIAAQSGRPNLEEPFLDMSNVAYRGVLRPFAAEEPRLRADIEQVQPVEFIPYPAQPRYYFAEKLVQARDPRELFTYLTTSAWKKGTAFVEFPPFSPARGVVRAFQESANGATLGVESAGQGFLVMSVTPHKYWSATLDGAPLKLVKANLGYQAAIIPAGPHRLEMRYRNPLVILGGVISLLSVAAVLGIAVMARRSANPVRE